MKVQTIGCLIIGLGILVLSLYIELQPPIIGTFDIGGTDAGCWFYRKNIPEHGPLVFYYNPPEEITMNINRRDLKLTEIDISSDKVWKFQANNFRVFLELGPIERYEGLCGISHSFPAAKLTVKENGIQTTILTKGACGCG